MNKQLNLDRRAPVWEALSELFIGKELQGYDYAAIVKALRESGYPVEELERMLCQEVAPVFRSNLSSLAVPEMEGWARETVVTEIQTHLARKQSGPWRMLERLIAPRALPELANDRWVKVRTLLD